MPIDLEIIRASALRGWQVRAFKQFEAALAWLAEEKERQPERGEQKVPIQPAMRRIEVIAASKRLTGGA